MVEKLENGYWIMNQEAKLEKIIDSISGAELEKNKDLRKFTTMRLKAVGDLITVSSVDALKEVLINLKNNEIEFIVLGMGANQLLKEKSDLPYLMLKLPFDKSILEKVSEKYIFPASVRLSVLTSHASKNSLKGWEVFTGIPATLGGATFMNAGTGLGEIGSLISRVWVMNTFGETKVIETDEKSFSYRKNNFLNSGEVIYQVEMFHNGIDKGVTEVIRKYLAARNASQPMSEWTCGCVFKNSKFKGLPCPAGKFIDIIGLKGLQVGGIRISGKHGNFMENFNDATFQDVQDLIALVRKETKMQFGVEFELEVKAE